MLRSRTSWRCAEPFDSDSSDWQIPAAAQTDCATRSYRKTSHRWYTSGMLATKTRAFGTPDFSVPSVCRNWARKVSTEVMVDVEDVQRSLAPMRIVTYRASWP